MSILLVYDHVSSQRGELVGIKVIIRNTVIPIGRGIPIRVAAGGYPGIGKGSPAGMRKSHNSQAGDGRNEEEPKGGFLSKRGDGRGNFISGVLLKGLVMPGFSARYETGFIASINFYPKSFGDEIGSGFFRETALHRGTPNAYRFPQDSQPLKAGSWLSYMELFHSAFDQLRFGPPRLDSSI